MCAGVASQGHQRDERSEGWRYPHVRPCSRPVPPSRGASTRCRGPAAKAAARRCRPRPPAQGPPPEPLRSSAHRRPVIVRSSTVRISGRARAPKSSHSIGTSPGIPTDTVRHYRIGRLVSADAVTRQLRWRFLPLRERRARGGVRVGAGYLCRCRRGDVTACEGGEQGPRRVHGAGLRGHAVVRRHPVPGRPSTSFHGA